MKINDKNIHFCKALFLILYYGFAQFLPNSYSPFVGNISNRIRIFCVRHIFKKCGKIKTINRRVRFATGRNIVIGDGSGIGANADIPDDTIIGENVMISRNVFILSRNHRFDRTDIPIKEQGYYEYKQTIIEDDVWIGLRTIMTPGRTVKKGTIVGMGSVLTKDFPEYSIVGGNPAKLIRSRI